MIGFFLVLAQLPFAGRAFSQVADHRNIAGFVLKGRIVDSADAHPMVSVSVGIMDEHGTLIVSGTTDKEGAFSISLARMGAFTLHASAIGYRSYTSAVIDIDSNKIKDLGTINLAGKPADLKAVVVSGKKALVQNKGDKIIYNAGGDAGNASGSAVDVLRNAPMLTVDADGTVKLRGSANLKVLLNGLPSGMLARNLTEALKMIPANTIASIEVITAPSAKYEAEGAAGVINIVTKKIRTTSGNVSLGLGSLEQTGSVGLSLVKDKFTFNLSTFGNLRKGRTVSEVARQSLYEGKEVGRFSQRNDTREEEKGSEGEFTAEFRPDSTQKLGASFSYFVGQWPEKSSLRNMYATDQATSAYDQRGSTQGTFRWFQLSLNYQKNFRRPGHQLQLLAEASKEGDHMGYSTDQYDTAGKPYFHEESPNKGDGSDVALQADYAYPFNKTGKNLLETGVRFSDNHSNSAYAVLNNRDDPGGLTLTKDLQRSDTMAYFQHIYAAYVSMKFEFKHSWTLRAGIRYEKTKLGADFRGPSPPFDASFDNIVPNLMLERKLNEQHDLRLSYTERIRRPWPWDLNPYVNASDPRNLTFGNPRLRPEVTRMVELTESWSGSSGLSIITSLYYGFNRNAIESIRTVDSQGVSRTTSQNIGSNQRVGMNITANTRLNQHWTMAAGAEYHHILLRSVTLNARNSGDFYSLSINSSYGLSKGYTIQASGNYNNRTITLQGYSTDFYNYQLSFRKEFLDKKASLTLSGRNLLRRSLGQKLFSAASTFVSDSYSNHYNRSVTLSFTYQFGILRSREDYNSGEGDAAPLRKR